MPASFPATIVVLATNVDNTDVVYAADMNAVQDEIIAIENTLGTNPQGGSATVKARIAAVESGKSDTSHTHDHGTLTGLADDDHPQYMLKSLGAGKGYLITFTASATPVALAPGADGTVLGAASAQASGLRYVRPTLSGLESALPAAAASNNGWFYVSTDTKTLRWSDGSTWSIVGGGAATFYSRFLN